MTKSCRLCRAIPGHPRPRAGLCSSGEEGECAAHHLGSCKGEQAGTGEGGRCGGRDRTARFLVFACAGCVSWHGSITMTVWEASDVRHGSTGPGWAWNSWIYERGEVSSWREPPAAGARAGWSYSRRCKVTLEDGVSATTRVAAILGRAHEWPWTAPPVAPCALNKENQPVEAVLTA